MGKTKNRKSRRRNRQVICPTDVLNEEELPEADDVSKTLEAALDKVKSNFTEEKECGASIIAQLTDDENFVAQLIECGGIKILAPLLVDSSLAVRHTVCGCLRNLSMNADVAEQMVRQDVMTPLVALFGQYSSKWGPSPRSNGKIDSRKEIFIEACNLLSCLCESSNTALEAFNRNNLIAVLLPCLNAQDFSLDVVLAVAECLHTVTENNPDAIAKTGESTSGMLYALLSITPTEAGHIQLQTVAAGVILNLCLGKISFGEPTGCSILRMLEHTLNLPIQCDVEKIAEDIKSHQEEQNDKHRDPDVLEKKLSCIVGQLKSLQCILNAKRTALEILTNMCSSDEEDVEESCSSTSSEEFVDNEDMSVPFDFTSSIPCEVRQFIIEEKILQKVLQQIVIPNDRINELFNSISHGTSTLKRLHTVRCRALLCINNIVQELSLEELGSAAEVFKLWMDLSVLVFSQTAASDSEQLEAATGSVRAVLQKLVGAPAASHFGKMTENDLKLFFDMWLKCSDSSARVNILRSVGTVGCILADLTQPNAQTLIKLIGAFLIEACASCSDLWVVSEALDAIFDLFSEDHLDFIAQEISLVEKLKQILPLLKGKNKLLRSIPQHIPIIKMAKVNLLRFLKYKEKYYREAVAMGKRTNCT